MKMTERMALAVLRPSTGLLLIVAGISLGGCAALVLANLSASRQQVELDLADAKAARSAAESAAGRGDRSAATVAAASARGALRDAEEALRSSQAANSSPEAQEIRNRIRELVNEVRRVEAETHKAALRAGVTDEEIEAATRTTPPRAQTGGGAGGGYCGGRCWFDFP